MTSLQVINGCELLIEDLIQGNKNIYHEIGLLMGLNQGHTAAQENFIRLVDNKKTDSDTGIGFNLRPGNRCVSTIRWISRKSWRAHWSNIFGREPVHNESWHVIQEKHSPEQR